MLEDGVDRKPLINNLQKMVTIPRTLNVDKLQYRFVSEPQMTQERTVINRSNGVMIK
jgi:hypothetical protein